MPIIRFRVRRAVGTDDCPPQPLDRVRGDLYGRHRAWIPVFTVALVLLTPFIAPGPAPAAGSNPSRSCPALIEGLKSRYAGDLDSAIAAFERAAFEDGDLAATFLHLGMTYELKGDKLKARRFYHRALELEPDYPCAKYFLDRLEGGHVGKAASRKARLVDSSAERVSPGQVLDSFYRYRGRTVSMKGRLLCWPCTRSARPVLLVDSGALAGNVERSGADMKNVFVVRLEKKLPDDPRIRRGAIVTVRGRVTGRTTVWDPSLKIYSADKRPVLEPEHIKIVDERSMEGPLNFFFDR